MSNERLLILGAGGHGKAVAEAAEASGMWGGVAFLDDRWPGVQEIHGWSVLSNIAGLGELASQFGHAIAAVGNNAARERLFGAICDVGLLAATVVHPSACVSPRAVIGAGSAVMALAVVGCDARLGEGCIINAHATVDHDAVLGDFAHLGVGVHLAGGVRVGSRCWLQAGSSAGYGVVVPDGQVFPPGAILMVA